jgi:hypothetical protein
MAATENKSLSIKGIKCLSAKNEAGEGEKLCYWLKNIKL